MDKFICVNIKPRHILFTGVIGHGWMPVSGKSTLHFNMVFGGEDVNGYCNKGNYT
jgi:hypothetical protein